MFQQYNVWVAKLFKHILPAADVISQSGDLILELQHGSYMHPGAYYPDKLLAAIALHA